MDVTCIHLDGNADAVEFCPEYLFQHILAAATYTLQESSQPCRVGILSLFPIHGKTHLKFLQKIKTSGIFDIKRETRRLLSFTCSILSARRSVCTHIKKGENVKSMATKSAGCPFCHIQLPFSEIEWHVNNHLDEEEFSRDSELALQLASPTEANSLATPKSDVLAGQDTRPGDYARFSHAIASSNKGTCGQKGLLEILEGEHIHDQVSLLVSCQIKSNFYRIEEGLMSLLRKCLEEEHGLTCSAISGHIDHFQSTSSEDLGWGCGWRNIQMLSSHILTQTYGAKEMLFGGSGFVPDIPSRQKWLEIAWMRGFDVMGADSLNFEIYGCRKWIGTTECAALLRSFGLRAHIVDFGCEAVKNKMRSADGQSQIVQGRARGTPAIKTNGPLDKFLHFEVQCDGCEAFPIRGFIFESTQRENFHICSDCMNTGKYPSLEFVKFDAAYSSTSCSGKEFNAGKSNNHQVLFDWVWNYFVGEKSVHSKATLEQFKERVITSQQSPLYFQHNGHSRTIVGIQRRRKSGSGKDERELGTMTINEVIEKFKTQQLIEVL